MLWSLVVVLITLWFLGVVNSCLLGGSIHLLLASAAVVALVQLIQDHARMGSHGNAVGLGAPRNGAREMNWRNENEQH